MEKANQRAANVAKIELNEIPAAISGPFRRL